MEICLEKDDPYLGFKKIFSIFIITGYISGSLVLNFGANVSSEPAPILELASIQENSVLPLSNPEAPIKVKKMKVVVTGYSSTVWQTDDTPYITASGKTVKHGIVANNKYSFGAEIKFPEVYGDEIFIVEDRMNSKKGPYHFDIWMDSYEEAKNFGVKIIEAEIILEN